MDISNISNLLSKRVVENEVRNEDHSDNFNKNDVHECIKFGSKEYISSLTERDVGITEYLRKGNGYSAVIKQRFSDFQVLEVNLEGTVAHITDTSVPEPPEQPFDLQLEEGIINQIESLLAGNVTQVEIDVTEFDKDKRKDLHFSIKKKFGSSVISNTVEENDSKKIVIKLNKKNDDDRWPDGIPKFLHFIVFKSNEDTMTVVNTLSKFLRIKPTNVSYAGTKDKRGQSTQWMCLKTVKADRLVNLNKKLRNIKTGNYVYKNEPLRLGDLSGNHFIISLRNAQADDDVIKDSLNSLKTHGFINYFGLQRFGNCTTVPTHEIGKALIKSDFRSAVDLVLKPRPEKDFGLSKARAIWAREKNANDAIRVLGNKKHSIEGKLLYGLSKDGNNFAGAFGNIPRNGRLLYLHAYQSYIWNNIVSKRIQTYGMTVLAGDLVFKEKPQLANDDSQSETKIVEEDFIKIITEEEVNQYSIYDIVLPLPGHAVIYPKNVIREWYEQLLTQDNLSFTSFKNKNPEYSLPGGYRNILHSVKDMSYKIVYYSDPDEDLILSDFDKDCGKTLTLKEEGPYKAVIVEFKLDTCGYATMALREVLKIDTSTMFQKSLNQYGNKRQNNSDDYSGDEKKQKTS